MDDARGSKDGLEVDEEVRKAEVVRPPPILRGALNIVLRALVARWPVEKRDLVAEGASYTMKRDGQTISKRCILKEGCSGKINLSENGASFRVDFTVQPLRPSNETRHGDESSSSTSIERVEHAGHVGIRERRKSQLRPEAE